MGDEPTVFAVRFESGARLPAAAEEAAAALGLGFCDVAGLGELAWVELQPAAGEARRLGGPLDLLSLRGRLRCAGEVSLSDWFCTVSRETGNGIEVLGGRLVAAECSFAEIALTPLVAAGDAPAPRAAAGPLPTGGSAPAAAPAPAIPARAPAGPARAAALFAEAIAESRRQEASAPDGDRGDEVRPSRGDIVNHLQFGRCEVLRIDDDHVTLRKPGGRTVQLGLPILAFTEVGAEGSRRVFDVRVGRS